MLQRINEVPVTDLSLVFKTDSWSVESFAGGVQVRVLFNFHGEIYIPPTVPRQLIEGLAGQMVVVMEIYCDPSQEYFGAAVDCKSIVLYFRQKTSGYFYKLSTSHSFLKKLAVTGPLTLRLADY